MKVLQGVDLVALARFQEVLSRHPALARDLFTERERTYCESQKSPAIHFAGRFAAKEAALKALGIGVTTGIDRAFREVEVTRAESGKPILALHGWLGTLGERLRVHEATVSISHSGEYVIAMVILLCGAESNS
ncbi:MAG TPA: holo-ACP synthase [Methylomirabilota bacterium]|nr:holo-ACP synthase [Methylomirabilota bacterium]